MVFLVEGWPCASLVSLDIFCIFGGCVVEDPSGSGRFADIFWKLLEKGKQLSEIVFGVFQVVLRVARVAQVLAEKSGQRCWHSLAPVDWEYNEQPQSASTEFPPRRQFK